MKKKGKFSFEVIDDLQGFEEYIEYLGKKKELLKKTNSKHKSSVQEGPLELYNFLIREADRLEKVNQLFSKKIKNLTEKSHFDNLIISQKSDKDVIKNRILDKMCDPNSEITLRISEFFNSAFNA